MSYNYFHLTVAYLSRVIFITVLLITLMVNSNASSIQQFDVSELIEKSELVFEGRVLSSEARWNENQTLIQTFITFEVSEIISGSYEQNTLELSFVGGRVGNDNIEAQGMRQPAIGEKGIYFVHSLTRELLNPLVGWSQGQFLLKEDSLGNDMVMTDSHRPITGLRKSQINNKAFVTTRSASFSHGIASDVMLNKDKNARDSAMSATQFKKELKARMKNLNQ